MTKNNNIAILEEILHIFIRFMRCRLLIFLILFAVIGTKTYSQSSKIHYLTPVSATDPIGDQWIYISTSSKEPVSYEIKLPSGVIYKSGEVSNEVPAQVEVGNGTNSQIVIDVNSSSRVLYDKGLIIEAEDEIYVSLRMNSRLTGGGAQNQAGTIVSKGDEGLGKKFYSGTFNHRIGSHHSFVSMMATEDNTNISITIPNNRNTTTNQSGTIQITLNKYESYLINSQGSNNDLKASYVESDKPIIVQSGSASGSLGQNGGQDYGMDQLVGFEKIGNEYILVQGERGNDANLDIENILIIATENGTTVNVNENPQNLDKGQTLLLEGGTYRNGTIYLNSNNDIYVFQGLGRRYANSAYPDANQGLFIVPPLSCST
ncbi:hypothetical protein EB155_13375, partial [archaeon]|nr:hypothetical protein [archaeon]